MRPCRDRRLWQTRISWEQALKAWLIGVIGACFLALTGAGELARCQAAPASLAISPASLDFGDLAVGSQSQPATITISNPTNEAITLKDVLLSGIDFSEKTDCGQSLAAGAGCTIQVFFKPAIAGPRAGNLNITGSDSGSPHFVAVVGTGK